MVIIRDLNTKFFILPQKNENSYPLHHYAENNHNTHGMIIPKKVINYITVIDIGQTVDSGTAISCA